MLLCDLAPYSNVVTIILDYLEPSDLCALCCTSNECRSLVFADPRARKRRENYVKEIIEIKELVGSVSSIHDGHGFMAISFIEPACFVIAGKLAY